MKPFKLYAFSVIASVCALLSSCGNDGPEVPDINKGSESASNLLTRMSSGEVNATYTRYGLDLFQKDDDTGGKWKEVNLREIVGWGSSLPNQFSVKDGRTWIVYEMWHSCGPSPLEMPWKIYCKVMGIKSTLYICTPIIADNETHTLKISNMLCAVTDCDGKNFTLVYDSNYYYDGPDYKTGTFRDCSHYKYGELSDIDAESVLWFETEEDLIKGTIALMRERFGDEMNMNDYLGGYVILDEPIVNFDDLEQQLLSGII